MADTEKPWTRRMAEEMAKVFDCSGSVGFSEAVLEAAGDLKAARLRVLLAQCYEIIGHSDASGDPAKPDDGFMDIVEEAIR